MSWNAQPQGFARPKRRVRELFRSPQAGQRDRNPCAAHRRFVDPDVAAMACDDRAGDSEPQAAAAGGAVAGNVTAVEALENALTLGRRYARAIVLDDQDEGLPLRPGRKRHAPVGPGVAAGV
jgi:hypothetical protein